MRGTARIRPTDCAEQWAFSDFLADGFGPALCGPTFDMTICLRGDIIADDLVDISIRRSEVLPYLAASALWLRIDELDPGAKQSAARNRKVVDFKGHYWPAAEELVMFIL